MAPQGSNGADQRVSQLNLTVMAGLPNDEELARQLQLQLPNPDEMDKQLRFQEQLVEAAQARRFAEEAAAAAAESRRFAEEAAAAAAEARRFAEKAIAEARRVAEEASAAAAERVENARQETLRLEIAKLALQPRQQDDFIEMVHEGWKRLRDAARRLRQDRRAYQPATDSRSPVHADHFKSSHEYCLLIDHE